MFKKILGIVFLVSGAWGMIASASAQTESITFTTYYPSPYGVYKNLRIYPSSDCNPSNACSSEGEICYYSSAIVTERGLKVCSPDPANPNTLIWTALGGAGGGGWWTRTVTNTGTTNLYPNEPTWNVGIGTATPQEKLEIKDGGIFINAKKQFGGIYPNNFDYKNAISFVGTGWHDGLQIFSQDPGPGQNTYCGDVYSCVIFNMVDRNVPPANSNILFGETIGTTGVFTPIMAIRGDTRNVGIGTTNPGTNRLKIEGGTTETAGGLIIEKRTTNPGSPATGQMWLCTDTAPYCQ
jgi:hypothetical protein